MLWTVVDNDCLKEPDRSSRSKAFLTRFSLLFAHWNCCFIPWLSPVLDCLQYIHILYIMYIYNIYYIYVTANKAANEAVILAKYWLLFFFMNAVLEKNSCSRS